ncbi:MAG: hypothetical protein DRP03_03055 [Candidatus Aenigmatarchaeota archaeon]|nr:MAG: hypothetical protein DRP03_03055 [Candidatus Aenigmarchaeota archaeon]
MAHLAGKVMVSVARVSARQDGNAAMIRIAPQERYAAMEHAILEIAAMIVIAVVEQTAVIINAKNVAMIQIAALMKDV